MLYSIALLLELLIIILKAVDYLIQTVNFLRFSGPALSAAAVTAS